MNLTSVEQSIKEFITTRINIVSWDLDEPDVLTYEVGGNHYPANTAKQLPIQNLTYNKETFNRVVAKAIFPYVITYRFYSELSFVQLPISSLANVLSLVQILALIQTPDPDITLFEVVEIEDSITVRRAEDTSNDWLVELNFAFSAEFSITEYPNVSDIQPPDFYDIENPPPLNELKVRINRAKSKFKPTDTNSYIEDSEFIINYQ